MVFKDTIQVHICVSEHLFDLKRILAIGCDHVNHPVRVAINGPIVRVQQEEHCELITILGYVDVVRGFVECHHSQLAASWENRPTEPEYSKVGIREQRHPVRGHARDVEFDVLT